MTDMTKPSWALVIRELYSDSSTLPSDNISTGHPFVTGDLNIQEAEDAVESLEEWGLIEREIKTREDWDSDSGKYQTVIHGYKLTSDGFEVAHERELSERNNKINTSLVFFTFILVLAQIIGVVPLGTMGKTVTSLFLLAGMFWAVRRADIMDF